MTSPRDEKRSKSKVNPMAAGTSQSRQIPLHRLRDANGVPGWGENFQEYNCGMTLVEISAQVAVVFAESCAAGGAASPDPPAVGRGRCRATRSPSCFPSRVQSGSRWAWSPVR